MTGNNLVRSGGTHFEKWKPISNLPTLALSKTLSPDNSLSTETTAANCFFFRTKKKRKIVKASIARFLFHEFTLNEIDRSRNWQKWKSKHVDPRERKSKGGELEGLVGEDGEENVKVRKIGVERRGWKGAEGKRRKGERDGRKQTLVNESHQGRLKRFPAAVRPSLSRLYVARRRPGPEVNLSN